MMPTIADTVTQSLIKEMGSLLDDTFNAGLEAAAKECEAGALALRSAASGADESMPDMPQWAQADRLIEAAGYIRRLKR